MTETEERDLFAMSGDARVHVVRWMQGNEEVKREATRLAALPLALWPSDLDEWVEGLIRQMVGGSVRDENFAEVYALVSKEFERHLIAEGWKRPDEIPRGEWAWDA